MLRQALGSVLAFGPAKIQSLRCAESVSTSDKLSTSLPCKGAEPR